MLFGKDKQSIPILVFLLLSTTAGGQAVKSYKYLSNGNLKTSYAPSENQSLIINYLLPELNIENIINSNGTYYRVSIPGHVSSTVTGKPEVPVFSRLISIPEGSVYKVKITEVKTSRINPSGKKIEGILFPAQESETKEATQKTPRFSIDRTEYARRGIIGSDTVRIEPLGKVRNTHLANLIVSPVRYNPRSNILEVITSMKIEVIFSNTSGPVTKSLLPQSPLFGQSLIKGVLNYNPAEVIADFSDQPVKMIIITDTAFRKQLDPFIKWKTQKGFKVEVLYKGVGLAGNTYAQLKDTLTKIYNSATETDPPPEYLLIIGDVHRVPYYGTGNVTDMYYGEFDGNGDYIPEMYVGRLPVSDTTQLKSAVHKIIQYEKFQFADTNKFYTGAIAAAGNDAGYANYMNGQIKYAITNYLTPAANIREHHFYYPQADLNRQKDSIIKLINAGISFINYTGHGDANGWLHVNIKSDDVPSFRNKNMYPFVVSNACRTAQYNISNSFGNEMVVSSDKGAVGFIGCSNDSYWDEDYYWALGPGKNTAAPVYDGTSLGAYDRLFHTHGESPSDWYFTMGQINYAGNLAVSSTTSQYKRYYWETYNLVGDPSVIPIIGKPDSFNITLPDSLPNGLKSLSFTSEPFSYIAISHFDTLWDASFASASGSVVLDMPGLSDDSCLIVITGQNRYPIIKTVYFTDYNNEFLNLDSTGINDQLANNNGISDFGESLYLKLAISNLGLTDAQNVYAKIYSDSRWITINNDSAYIGNLPAKSEIILSDRLGITVSDSVPDMGVATVHLVLTDDKIEKHYNIDLVIHSPELFIINCMIDDKIFGNGDYIADPGESFDLVFTIQNKGSSKTSGQFSIISPANDITILSPSVKSGELKIGETADLPISVKLPDESVSGSYFSVFSTLDCSPYIINKEFTFRVGKIRESFESASFSIFPWINLSPVPWMITSASSQEGSISARSGAITHNGSTSLIIKTVHANPDSVRFSFKVSSEPNYDNLTFRLNGAEVFKKSGDIPWTRKAVAVPAGLNKLEWIYKKDQSVSAGSDCAWIDVIDFSVAGSVNYIQKDLQVAKIAGPEKKDQYGQETVTVKVLNVGKDILDGFNLAYSVNDRLPSVSQHFTNQVFPNGDSVTVSFNTKADMSKYGSYKIVAYGFNNNDDYAKNDTMQVQFENTMIVESISVFPNPFFDQLTIYVNSQAAENVRISITSVSGVKLYEADKYILAGNNTIVISDARLLPSLYYLNLRGTKINKTIPVLKIDK